MDLDALARRSDDLTGADLETLCKKAALVAIAEFQRGARTPPFAVSRIDFEDVLEDAPCIAN